MLYRLLSVALATVTLSALAATPPVRLEPSTVNFGNVKLGATASQSIKVINDSKQDVLLKEMLAYELTLSKPLPFTVPAGQSVDLEVSLTANQMGSYRRGLRIFTDTGFLALQATARVHRADGWYLTENNIYLHSTQAKRTVALFTINAKVPPVTLTASEGFSASAKEIPQGYEITVTRRGPAAPNGTIKVYIPDAEPLVLAIASQVDKPTFRLAPLEANLIGALSSVVSQKFVLSKWERDVAPIVAVEGQPIELRKDESDNYTFTLEAVVKQSEAKFYRVEVIDPLSRDVLYRIPVSVTGKQN